MRDREIRLAPIHHEAHDDLGLLLKFVLGVAVGIGLVVWWIA